MAQACIEIKILKQESDLRLSRLGFLYYFNFSFHFSFFSFSFLCAAVIGLLMGLLAVKKLQRKHHQDEQILPWSSHVYWQEILLQIFHSTFCAYLRRHEAEHSDLGIIEKIFSTCRS